MQEQENENFEHMERGTKGMEDKEYQWEDEKGSYPAMAIGSNPTKEDRLIHMKRKSSFNEMNRRGSISANSSIQKL